MLYPLFAQLSFGVKGGVNYDSFGELNPTDLSLENFQSDAKTGFHIGVFGNLDLLTFYLRPELQFSQSVSQFNNNETIALNKLEAPVLLGYKILGPLSILLDLLFNTFSKKRYRRKSRRFKGEFYCRITAGYTFKIGPFRFRDTL